jgi:acyl-CoA thioesterase FadM
VGEGRVAEPFAHTMRVRYAECDALGVVFNAHMQFHAPARFDEEIMLEATVAHIGTTSLITHHRIRRHDELLLGAEMVHVWVRHGSAQKTPIPDWARTGLEPWHEPQAA